MVGDKTFGGGSVQKVIEVPDGSALILSVAKYYTPTARRSRIRRSLRTSLSPTRVTTSSRRMTTRTHRMMRSRRSRRPISLTINSTVPSRC